MLLLIWMKIALSLIDLFLKQSFTNQRYFDFMVLKGACVNWSAVC